MFNESRGLVFSTYVMITLTVIGAGQMLLVLYDPRDMHLFAIASVLVSLAAIPVVLSQAPQPEHPVTVSVDIRRVYHISRSGTVGCLASGLANGTFWALAPLFVAAYSDNLNLAAIFMTAGVAGGAIAQWPMGYLSDRIGRRRTLVVAGMIGVAMSTFVMLQSAAITPIVLVFIGVVWGAASFPLYAIAVAQANDYADASDYVMLSSGLLLMYGAGAIVGPFVASAVMTILPGRGMFLFTGVTHVLLVIYTVNRIMRRGRAPAEHHMAFSDALATAHTASQVYEEEFQHHVEKDDNK
jgi:MFS family permease